MAMSWSVIMWAGFAATVLSASTFWLWRSLGWTRFSPTTQLGCLFVREPNVPLTDTVGLLLFISVGSTVVAAAYARLLAIVPVEGWLAGAVAGLLHGLAAAAVLPVWHRLTACGRSGRLPDPGRLGVRWGRGTPAALAVGHAAYGAVLGAILAAG
jgi:hypothetical protein